MNIESLMELDVEEFGDELRGNIGNLAAIEPFLDPRVIGRTYDYLDDAHSAIEGQLDKFAHAADKDVDWERRARGLHKLMGSRLRLVSRRMKAAGMGDPSQRDGSYSAKAWREFAHKIVALVDAQGDDALCGAVEKVMIPPGDLNAFEWLDRRIEKDPRRELGLVA